MKLNTTLKLLRSIEGLQLLKATPNPFRVQVSSKYGTMVLEANPDEALAIIRGWLTPELAARLKAETTESQT